MVEQAPKHLPYLDGWRGLAIALLLVGHFFPIPGVNLGAVGVNLFFVLSGLLMARLLFIEQTPIALFYRRRVARIFPAVYAFMMVVLVAYASAGLPLSWPEIAAAATFMINYFPGEPGAAVMPFGHIWSLCVEEHSYVVLSLLAIAARRWRWHPRYLVGAAALASGLSGLAYWLSYKGAHLGFDRWLRTEVAAFGLLASALLLLCLHGRRLRLPALTVPALLAAGLMLHWWSVPAPVQTVGGVGLFALAINLLPGAPAWLQRMFSMRILRQLGLWSYSIYLWQQPFYLLHYRTGLAPGAALSLAVAAGVLSYYLLERPARAFLNRRWAGRQEDDVKPIRQADVA